MKKIKKIASHYSMLHKKICRIFEDSICNASLTGNRWETETGFGVTSVMQNGNIIEKGGINFSFVHGSISPNFKKIVGEEACYYHATGISSIMHPVNPHAPIIHMNVRYFTLDNGTEWFGGGIDLTPHFIDIVEARSFHNSLKELCDRYDKAFYPKFKEWADNYFYIPHRNETRGIGGIFFDKLKPEGKISFDQLLSFTKDLVDAYPYIYKEIMLKKSKIDYSESETKWQQIRRGRYVEFNLIYDRGTKFGIESGRNIESTIISLPKSASWEYNFNPKRNSPEDNTLRLLKKKNIDWINYTI
jgi:coproporphyrinogen III oxidase